MSSIEMYKKSVAGKLAVCESYSDPRVVEVAMELARRLAMAPDSFICATIPVRPKTAFDAAAHVAKFREVASTRARERGLGPYVEIERLIGWMSAHRWMSPKFMHELSPKMQDVYWKTTVNRVQAIADALHVRKSADVQGLEEMFASPADFGVTHSTDHGVFFEDESGLFDESAPMDNIGYTGAWANRVAQKLGHERVEIVDIDNDHISDAEIARQATYYLVAIVDGRYLIDGFNRHFKQAPAKVAYDLTDPADQSEVIRLYGDGAHWRCVTDRTKCYHVESPVHAPT